MAWKERARRKVQARKGVQECRDLVADIPLNVQEGAFKTCLLDQIAQDIASLTYSTSQPPELAACLAGKVYAPDEETAREFEQWCYVQVGLEPSPHPILKPESPKLIFHTDDEEVADEEYIKKLKEELDFDYWWRESHAFYYLIQDTDVHTIAKKVDLPVKVIRYIQKHLQKEMQRRPNYTTFRLILRLNIVGYKIRDIARFMKVPMEALIRIQERHDWISSGLSHHGVGRIGIYDHHEYLEANALMLLHYQDDLLNIQLNGMPRTYFLYSRPSNTIAIVDPIGQTDPASPHKDLFRPDFHYHLRQFAGDIRARQRCEPDIYKITNTRPGSYLSYNIKIAISHGHPDHWGGLAIVLDQLWEAGYRKPIELIIPAGLEEKVREYQKYFIDPENAFIQARLEWSDAFLAVIRQVCDLYFGQYQDLDRILAEARLPVSLRPVKAEHPYYMDDWIEFFVVENVHGGSSLLYAYPFREPVTLPFDFFTEEILFLDDFYLPGYAMSSSLPPTTRLGRYFAFFDALRARGKIRVNWSHFYPLTRVAKVIHEHKRIQRARGKMAIEEPVPVRDIFSRVKALKTVLERYFYPNYRKMKRNGQEFAAILDALFKDEAILAVVHRYIFFQRIDLKLIQQTIANLLKLAPVSALSLGFERADEGLLSERITHLKFQGPEFAPGRRVEQSFAPKDLQVAIFIITFYLNALAWCERRLISKGDVG